MINKKRLLSFFLTALLALALFGCNKTTLNTSTQSGSFTLPDLSGYSTEDVKTYFDNAGINYKIQIKSDLIYSEDEYSFDKFYGYAGAKNEIGASFDTTKRLTVYVTAQSLPETMSEVLENNATALADYDSVTLEGKTYEGKSFLTDGIGVVTVSGYTDGDTTRFKDKNGTIVSLRYLGVDTPESTAAFEPWGKAASDYTETCLKNAKKIVLESEPENRMDGNGRYLGWVWYLDADDDWHLLNLELIAFCYSKDKASTDSLYCNLAIALGNIASATGRRVHGEHDPNYDYSTDAKEISLQELRTNFAAYYGRKVKVTGVIAFMDGMSPFIIDEETGYGVYYYIPIWTSSEHTYNIVLGNKITIEGVATYYGSSSDSDASLDEISDDLANGSPQLTDFKAGCVTLVSKNNTVNPTSLTINDISQEKLGMYVTMTNLTIIDIYEAKTGSGTTITAKDANKKEIAIRIDSSHYYIEGANPNGIDMSKYEVDDKIASVTGGLSYFYGYQVMIVDNTNIVLG